MHQLQKGGGKSVEDGGTINRQRHNGSGHVKIEWENDRMKCKHYQS